MAKKPRKKPEKNEALQELKSARPDRALQRLAWGAGCQRAALAHQPEAVPAVAGALEAFLCFANDDGRGSRSTSEVLESGATAAASKGKGAAMKEGDDAQDKGNMDLNEALTYIYNVEIPFVSKPGACDTFLQVLCARQSEQGSASK